MYVSVSLIPFGIPQPLSRILQIRAGLIIFQLSLVVKENFGARIIPYFGKYVRTAALEARLTGVAEGFAAPCLDPSLSNLSDVFRLPATMT
jgi:hypothetical protein